MVATDLSGRLRVRFAWCNERGTMQGASRAWVASRRTAVTTQVFADRLFRFLVHEKTTTRIT